MSKDMQPLEAMFPDLISKAKWLGFGIRDGWRSLIIDSLQAFKDSLSPDDLRLFKLVQVKEKFGTLRIYYEASGITPVDLVGPDGVARVEVDIDKHRVRLSDEGRLIVRKIIEKAENRSARTCEDCGSPGRLYGGGYAQTLCDEHAKEAGKTFPKAYGELLECRPRSFRFPDRFRDDDPIEEKEAICEHVLLFKDTRADVWYWSEDTNKEGWFFLEDVPERFLNAFFDWKDAHPEETHYLPYSAPESDQIQTLFVEDFLTTINKVRQKEGATSILEPFFTMPAGVKVDARTQLERDIKECFDCDVRVTAIIRPEQLGGLAVGRLKDGTHRLFATKPDGRAPEEFQNAAGVLRARIAQLDALKATLEVELVLFEDEK